MADKKLLSCLKRRDLLNSDKVDNSELISYGQHYLLEGRLSDTIDFFERAGYVEGLIELKEPCIAEGDYFLLRRLAKILADSPSAEEWMRLGDNALTLSKLLFARSAFLEAESHEKVAQIDKLLQNETKEKAGDKKMLH